MQKKSKTILLTAGIVLLGFIREYLFVNINWIYLTLVNGRMNGARKEFHFLLNWTPQEIVVLKWSLTFVFTIWFFFMTWLIIKIYFEKKEYNKIVIYSYLTLTLIALLLAGIGKITGSYETLYGGIHNLMSLAQSFMPLMLLFVVFKFFSHDKLQSR